jgi:hypothetical protein
MSVWNDLKKAADTSIPQHEDIVLNIDTKDLVFYPNGDFYLKEYEEGWANDNPEEAARLKWLSEEIENIHVKQIELEILEAKYTDELNTILENR